MAVIRISESKIHVNGREYHHVDEMPPDIRRIYGQVIENVDPTEFDIYDEPWRETKRDEYFKPHDDELMPSQPQSLTATPSVIEEVSSNRNLVILLIVASVILCFGVIVWLITSGFFTGI